MFLDFAEDRAKRRQKITMQEWIVQSKDFLKFNERSILEGPRKRSHDSMVSFVEKQYSIFEENRSNDELNKDLEELIQKTRK